MAATVRYELYDVFTSTPFAGNPLAVAVDPPPLSDVQHQLIARELNLSETVFVSREFSSPELGSRDAGEWTARIFTPARELPFAGHPTIGAAIALHDLGHIDGRVDGQVDGRVVLHEGVGPVAVEVAAGSATLTTPVPPTAVDVADIGQIVEAIGLRIDQLHPSLGPRGWSAGVPFTMVAVRDAATLSTVSVDVAAWQAGVATGSATSLYVLAPLEGERGRRWRARMFAPGFGISEDPATGSAAAAAVGFLAGVAGETRLRDGWTIEQGVEMGRPSELHVAGVCRGGELVAVTLAGEAVRVGGGELLVPHA